MAKIEEYPLTLKDAAHKLSTTRNAVRRFVAAGKLPAETFGPLRELRFKDEDVAELLEKMDPAKLERRIAQRIKANEPHYQGLMNLPG